MTWKQSDLLLHIVACGAIRSFSATRDALVQVARAPVKLLPICSDKAFPRSINLLRLLQDDQNADTQWNIFSGNMPDALPPVDMYDTIDANSSPFCVPFPSTTGSGPPCIRKQVQETDKFAEHLRSNLLERPRL
ncbi:MAG: hypothetical protein M1819_002310 [Sarea resinae]|nr:MAG: hypothetical protein M1819_002310 [Sarea resinae]